MYCTKCKMEVQQSTKICVCGSRSFTEQPQIPLVNTASPFPGPDPKYCSQCKTEVLHTIIICPKCGNKTFTDKPTATLQDSGAVKSGIKYCKKNCHQVMESILICPTCGDKEFTLTPPAPPWIKWGIAATVAVVLIIISIYIIIPPPIDKWLLLREADQLVETGKFTDAISVYGRVIEKFPNFVEAHTGLGHALMGAMKYEDAIRSYTTAINLDPKYIGAFFGRGWSYRLMGDLRSAANDFQELVNLDPHGEVFYEVLADILNILKQPQAEAELWRKGALKNPDWKFFAHRKRIEALVKAEAWGSIRREVAELLKDDVFKNDAELYYLLGRSYNQQGSRDLAVAHLKKAVELVLREKVPVRLGMVKTIDLHKEEITFLDETKFSLTQTSEILIEDQPVRPAQVNTQAYITVKDYRYDLLQEFGEELLYAYGWGGRYDEARRWEERLNQELAKAKVQ